MPNRFAFFLLFLLPLTGFSQIFGGNPAKTRWSYFTDQQATLIYPKGADSSANRIAQLISRINARTDSSIGVKRRPISIIIQTGTTRSNGYVALAPYRSEFYLTPPANPFSLGALDWVDQLALHEYRHVQQYSNFNLGGAKIFKFLLGEQGQALANALTVPDWFFEGDAVFQETQFSHQGRGRTPSFFNGYRALWDAGIDYSFMKLRNGSLKHFVPDHYELGYQLVAYGRDTYGTAFWKNTTSKAAAMKGLVYPLQKAVKQETGLSYPAFIEQALANSRKRIGRESAKVHQKPPVVVNTENTVFTEQGDLVYLKSSYRKIPSFFIQKDGVEQKIRTKDQSLDHYFGYAKNKIVYASYRPDIRWGWIDYSELQLLDVRTGQQKRISHKSRYFSPSLSVNADSIVAVHIPVNGQQRLELLLQDGHKIVSIPNIGNFSFFHPVFWKDKILVVAKNDRARMNLLLVDIPNGGFTSLLPWTENVLGFPTAKGDTIYFTMSYKEKDRIMAFDAGSQNLYLLQSGSDSAYTGLYQPAVFGKEIVQTRFTAAGYSFRKETVDRENWLPVNDLSVDTASNFQVHSLNDPVNALTENNDHKPYIIHKYRKTTRFFNFHSWQPYYEDPEFSFSLFGQNVLNTFQSQLYFKYNRNEGFKQLGYTGIFGGFFPLLKGDLNYTLDRRGIFENRTIYWDQFQSSLGFTIPLNLSKGRSISFLQAGSDLVFNQDNFKEPERSKLGTRSYWYFDHDIRFSHQVQQARQEFNPRFAQTLHLNFRQAISQFDARQFMETSDLYFPGFFLNHSFVVNLAAQQRDSSKGLRFTNDFPFARGYSSENFYRVIKWGINYQLPIIYPDYGAWNIVYLLRVRTNFFYDQAMVKDQQLLPGVTQKMFRSVGNELFFDTKWWNQLPVNFGIRYARLLDEDIFGGSGKNRWQFILPVSLIPAGINAKRSLGF
ncbi:hypothetical protein [Flavihumibacter fluvii]|uniref:hypothetical protein n=1 Tax=Flavihumibacter fluvii TaxID=2838157 RepID=UPI001BDF0BC9|nr:hypothetical protein [Flavihumibacter fluvii]ULQ53794.1 hypothetical protein KJS93_05590 [Flavihumibacter fluvii]